MCEEGNEGSCDRGLGGIRESMDYRDSVNQRLHSWPYRKIINMLKYKEQLAGIYDTIDEKNTSRTCHGCGKILPSNRKHIEACTLVLAAGRHKQM
jgi:transposase